MIALPMGLHALAQNRVALGQLFVEIPFNAGSRVGTGQQSPKGTSNFSSSDQPDILSLHRALRFASGAGEGGQESYREELSSHVPFLESGTTVPEVATAAKREARNIVHRAEASVRAESLVATRQSDRNEMSVKRRSASDVIFVQDFGAACDGRSDDTAGMQRAIDAASEGSIIYLLPGACVVSAPIVIKNKRRLTITGTPASVIKCEDGNYSCLLITGKSSEWRIDNVTIRGVKPNSSKITLIKVEGTSAYGVLTRSNFSYARYGIRVSNSYIIKIVENVFSNIEQYIQTTTTEGSTVDILIQGNTFGTTRIGGLPAMLIQSNGTRVQNNYFELQTHTKRSLDIATGSQGVIVSGNTFENSGGIIARTSTNPVIVGNVFKDAYDAEERRVLQFESGTSGVVVGNFITLRERAAITCIDVGGSATASGNFLNRCDTAIFARSIAMGGNAISGSAIGVATAPGSHGSVVGFNLFSGNGQDVKSEDAAEVSASPRTADPPISETTSRQSNCLTCTMPARELIASSEVIGNPMVSAGEARKSQFHIAGAKPGDFVQVSYSAAVEEIEWVGMVIAENTVTVIARNQGANAIALPVGTVRVIVRRAQ